ncbi:MAG: glycosyltransferase [Candidatus Atribacteria bacterium]|nr:glycosyltransferase [Candidatus Atribacteria bacterium]
MNKAICLIDITGSFGGAQKRYATLFNHISKERKDYYLIINYTLYELLRKEGILTTESNIIFVNLGKADKPNSKPPYLKNSTATLKISKKKNSIIQTLGGIRAFAKLSCTWLIFVLELFKIIRSKKIRLVYGVWHGGIWLNPVKRLLGIKLIYSYNNANASDLDTKWWRYFESEYWVIRSCDKIDFLSKHIIQNLENVVGPISASRITITNSSFINYEHFFPDNEKNNSVVFLSRLISDKNPKLYLESIEQFNKTFAGAEKIQFYLIGNGILYDELDDFIKRNELDNVRLIKNEYQPAKYLRKSKVFVSIQQNENYPSQSLIEAMACENAVIASNVGQTSSLVTNSEGILVNLTKYEIADALTRLFSDQQLINTYGKQARNKVLSEHTIENFASHFYSIINSFK